MLLVRYYDIVIGYIIGPIFRYKVKTEGIIQIDFEFQGNKFWRLLASELSFMGSIAYRHNLINTVCESKYARSCTMIKKTLLKCVLYICKAVQKVSASQLLVRRSYN